MTSYVLRRIGISILIILAASFLMYTLVALARDPLEDLRASNQQNKDILIAQRIQWLGLNDPIPVRWLNWVGGAVQCVAPGILQCDLGVNIQNQSVAVLLGRAMGSTLQLVTGATILAIILGIAVGIVSALRQYSALDYTFTFVSFFLYSLPSFLMGVLLKVFLAIGFNNWLGQGAFINWFVIIAGALVAGIFWQAIIGGNRQRRLVIFAASVLVTGALLYGMGVTQWFLKPGLGPILAPLLIAAIAAGLVMLIAGSRARYAWRTAGAAAIIMIVAYFVLMPLLKNFDGILLLVTAVIAVGVGIALGFIFGEHDKGQAAKLGGLTALLGFGVIVLDQFLSRWPEYVQLTRGRPIATVGSSTPNMKGDFWILGIDSFTHLLLPTISLMLISFAGYTRYARGGMLETLNQDYIRTARAKGLPERTVVVRHAFRNSLIPITTIVAADVGAILGGAIITERIFAFSGMGAMFNKGLSEADPNPVMAYFLVIAIFAILFNFLADLAYSLLDPRVRAK